MEIKGTVKFVSETQHVNETFSKRFIVVEVKDGQYAQEIKLEAFKDKTSLFDDTPVGTEVEVHFNLNGRSWTNKQGVTDWFNSLVAWKIDVLTSTPVTAPTQTVPPTIEDGDMPF